MLLRDEWATLSVMNHVLFTPPLMIETANSAKYAVYCNVLNASSSARTGTLAIVNLDGTTLATENYVGPHCPTPWRNGQPR